MSSKKNILNKWLDLFLKIGPGIFAIGYTIGTGSVTSLIVAGSQFGMQLLWVLFLSCLFSWVLMEAYGRYAIVTGSTALYGFKKHLKFGNTIAILIIIGITFGQWNSLIGILGITANAFYETLSMFIPVLAGYEYLSVLSIAIIIIGLMYLILWKGKFSLFERILLFFVSLMGLSFLVSLFITSPNINEVVSGFIPSVPDVPGGKMLVAAFVGTTMASATFISRPLFIKGKKWGMEQMRNQQKDALWAALLIFAISTAIMAVASGAMFGSGQSISKVLDMVYVLEPTAGKFAVSIFFVGTMAAGLSSVFPILMIAPIMIADYKNGELDIKSKQFKLIAFVTCIIGLSVPLLGSNPIKAQILTQVLNVFVLPLVILSMSILINKKEIMGKYKAGWKLNTGLIAAFIFACIISFNGAIAIGENL